MSLAHIAKQIAQIPDMCSVCAGHGGFVALPPFRDVADRRCRTHLWPDFLGPFDSARVLVPPARVDESRPGAHSAAPSAPVRAGPGDLFGGLA